MSQEFRKKLNICVCVYVCVKVILWRTRNYEIWSDFQALTDNYNKLTHGQSYDLHLHVLAHISPLGQQSSAAK